MILSIESTTEEPNAHQGLIRPDYEKTVADRLEKELEEILEGDASQPREPEQAFPRDPVRKIPGSGFLGRLMHINIHPGKFMLTSMVILLVVLILYNSALSNVGSLVWVAVALFAGSYLLFFVNPSKSTPTKRWRGEVIEPESSLFSRIKKWIGR